ncbi:MAG: hypothetical protein RJA44_2577 [Pseudomonadota bacterium]|jgi:cell division protein ZapA
MKQVEVTIMGQSYILACPEGGESVLLEAVAAVDREMCAIRDAGRVKARERMAVLTALNMAYVLVEQKRAAQLPPPPPEPVLVNSALLLPPELDALVQRIDRMLDRDGQLI